MKLLTIRETTARSEPARETLRRRGGRARERLHGGCTREWRGAAALKHRPNTCVEELRRPLMPIAIALAVAAVLASIFTGCGEGSRRYEAEKALFEARKMREQLAQGRPSPEFFEKTVGAYRAIVEEYAGEMNLVDGLGEIVIGAQMELAEFEFHTGRLEEAITDFDKAYRLAEKEPAARANALYSTAFIAEAMEDFPGAVQRYERFYRDFLGEESVDATARMNSRYLITPLKLADLHARSGDGERTRSWLDEAERTYRAAIAGSEDSALVKEMRFNLLTTYMKGERWNDAHELIRELKKWYSNDRDLPGLYFIEAKIYRDGFKNIARALEILRSLSERYPESPEAANALMSAGGMQFEAGHYGEATRLYQSVIDTFGDTDAQIVEALWQLARIAEVRGNWVGASLYYKLIYTKHPGTIQGLEAPLEIANHYRDRNEGEAAASAYQRAIEHYESLVSSQISEEVRMLAEEYMIRAFAEQEKWREAAERLLELPDRYPLYRPFGENYLRAASIHERELNDPERAARILRDCMNRYPGTDLAAEAEKQYKRITGAR